MQHHVMLHVHINLYHECGMCLHLVALCGFLPVGCGNCRVEMSRERSLRTPDSNA